MSDAKGTKEKSRIDLNKAMAQLKFISDSASAHFAQIDFSLVYRDSTSKAAYRDLQDQLAELKIELEKLDPN